MRNILPVRSLYISAATGAVIGLFGVNCYAQNVERISEREVARRQGVDAVARGQQAM
jgi:hypothetical protein